MLTYCGAIPCIFVGGPWPMHIYCGTISHVFLLEGHSPCTFIVGPYPMHFCWDHSPCTFNVGPDSVHFCWEAMSWEEIFCEAISHAAFLAGHIWCTFEDLLGAPCSVCICGLQLLPLSPSQLGCWCAGAVRGVWFYGSQHVRTVHLWGGCAGQHVHWESHSLWQGRSSAGPRAHPRQESGNANNNTGKFLQHCTKMLVEISSGMLPTIMIESCAPPYPLLTILQEVSKGPELW